MPDPKDERHRDPRELSDKMPGRSRNQEEAPPLPAPAVTEKKHQDDRKRIDPHRPSTDAERERRDARGHSAMPFGTKGSRKGKPAGGSEPPQDAPQRP